MSSPLDGYAARARDRIETRRLLLGSPFHRMKDGITYTAQIRIAGAADVEMLRLEGGVSLLEMNPIVLDKVPLDCPIETGDYLLYPATGSVADDRYRVVSVQDKSIAGIVVKRIAVAIWNPER